MLGTMTLLDATIARARAPAGPAHTVAIGPIDRLDADALLRFFAALSAESRHARFLGSARVDGEAAAAMAAADGTRRLGLVARAPDSGEIVGHLCLEPSGPDEVEIGIVVADGWQGRGIGRRLLAEGLVWARRRGIRRLTGVALADNSRILRLACTLGAPCAIRSLGEGLVGATVTLEAAP